MASMPAVVDGNAQEHCKRRQQARRRRLVVDEKVQQHRPYRDLKYRFQYLMALALLFLSTLDHTTV